jgi:hypothetical protein
MATVGRNNEAIEQVVMRLSIEDDVSTLSWSVGVLKEIRRRACIGFE